MPRSNTPIIHPNLLGSWQDVGYFNRKCTIQSSDPTEDTFGQEIEGWADLVGHIDIPCRKGARTVRGVSETERAGPLATVVTEREAIILDGYYPDIQESHRAIVDGEAYDITGVLSDSASVMTLMTVEIVK